MGRFRIHLLLNDDTWNTRYIIPKKDRYGDSSTQWTLVSLNFTVQKGGLKQNYDEIDSASAICVLAVLCLHILYTKWMM